MIDGGIHVRVEPVLAWSRLFPCYLRLLAHEADPYDRLGALEAVLPWYHDPNGGAVLIRQHLPVQSECEQRERVKRLIQPQALHVGPIERGDTEQALTLSRELRRIVERGELDEPGLTRRFDPLDKGGERIADPRDHHRPPLDAPQAIDPFLQWE